MLAEAVERFEDLFGDEAVPAMCQSEIEGVLGVAFYVCGALGYYAPADLHNEWKACDWQYPSEPTPELIAHWVKEPNIVSVYPQVSVAKFRVDFMCHMRIEIPRSSKLKHQFLAVECDGHEFHERTKAQAARDRARDRALLLRGVPSMRFTGAEIWADAYACVTQIDRFFSKAFFEFQGAHDGRIPA